MYATAWTSLLPARNCHYTNRVHRKSGRTVNRRRGLGCERAEGLRRSGEGGGKNWRDIYALTGTYMYVGTSHSRKSSHEYRVETTGASLGMLESGLRG